MIIFYKYIKWYKILIISNLYINNILTHVLCKKTGCKTTSVVKDDPRIKKIHKNLNIINSIVMAERKIL